MRRDGKGGGGWRTVPYSSTLGHFWSAGVTVCGFEYRVVSWFVMCGALGDAVELL